MRDPEQPDPALDATVRLRIGEPLAPSVEATQQLTAGEPLDPASTQRLMLPVEATQQLTVGEPVNPASTQPVAPSVEVTQQLQAGDPVDPSSTLRMVLPVEVTQQLAIIDPVEPADTQRRVFSSEITQQMAILEPVDPGSTQRMTLPVEGTVKVAQPLPEADASQASSRPILNPGIPPILVPTSSSPVPPPPMPRRFSWKLPDALVGLVVLGAVVYGVLSRLPVPPPSASTPSPRPAVVVPHAGETLPASVQAYVDKAQAGDVNAMRMLGAMYYNGLDVPRDPVKGLAWYRKAAEQGSIAARAELDKLEQSGK